MAGCGGDDRPDSNDVASALPSTGPDPVVVRLARDGGTVRGYRYPNLDSLIWRSGQPAPAVERFLAFDPDNAVLAYLGRDGQPGWLDLRIGARRPATKDKLSGITSADGWAIFGISEKNGIVRLTPSGDWSHPSARPVRGLIPLSDGTLLVLADDGAETFVVRMRPPDTEIVDSVSVPRPERVEVTPLADRVYLSMGDRLMSLHPKELGERTVVEAAGAIVALAATPSGDRVFLANASGPRLEVLDRYSEELRRSVELPGRSTDLRMDPMGRYLIARPAEGDSAWIVAIATQELVATIPTAWRVDLPFVAADGLVAVVRGDDVGFIDPHSGEERRRVANGAADLWFATLWNGFRPRSRELDAPVAYEGALDSTRRRREVDTAAVQVGPTVRIPRDTTPVEEAAPPPPPPPPRPAPPPARDAWTVSFAAVLSEERAREIAAGITVDGQRPRVVQGKTDGTTIYRVVFGPYNSKADAERMGRASGHNFWVYEGVP